MADESTPDDGNNEPKPDGKTFTQADVDRIVRDRLERVKTTPPSDYDDLKAKAAKLDELEAANASDLEKANKRAEAAEQTAQSATDRANNALKRAELVARASAAGAADAGMVADLLMSNDAVTIGDDGQVTGAEEAVKARLEASPFLVGSTTPLDGESTTPAPSGDGGPRGSGDGVKQLSKADLASMTPEQIVEADNKGQLADLYAGKS